MNIKRLLLYPIIVVLGISLVSGLIPATPVNAAVSLNTDTDKATSYSYYQAVYSCFHNARVERDIATNKAGSPSDWVNDFWANNNNSDLKTGFLVNDSGKSGCKDILTKALQFWQLDAKTFLEGVGYKLSSDGTKYSIGDGNTQQDGFKSYISGVVGATANLNNKIQYELDIAALTKGCKDQNIGKLSGVDESTRRQAQSKSNDYYTVLVAEQDSSTNYYVFKKGDRPGSAIENYSSPPGIGGDPGGTADCVDVVAANITKASNAIARQRAQDLYNTYSNQLYNGLSDLIKADCPANQNAAIRTECQASWKDTFNKCFAGVPTTQPAQNGADGDPVIFQKPDDVKLAAISSCVAKGTGGDLKAILTALTGASNQFTTPINKPITPEDKSDKTSCAVESIGWIVCPVVTFLGGITDQAYTILSTFLLNVPATNLNTTDPNNGLYRAWEIMRNIANIAFVIAFLIIIFSQLSSVGVSNYGIKKLLPRLIVAAILVNVSYYVCAAAVDLSNILGNSLKAILDNIASSITSPVGDGFNKGNLFGAVIATIITSGTLYLLGLSILLPVLITALAAVVTTVAVLILRQALIILLIVVAPLAFVAYLLPNTEDLFSKWRKLLTTLLVMYPLIALVFGGSALAAKIVMTAGAGAGGGNAAMLTQIAGAGIAIIPLFITPIVMKTAGGMLNRFGGMVNNPNKGPFDRMRKGAEGFRNSRQALRDAKSYNRTGLARALDIRGYGVRHRGRTDAILKARQREAQIGSATDVADTVENGSGFFANNLKNSLAGGGGAAGKERAITNAANTLDQLEIAEVKAAQAILQRLNLSQSQLSQLEQGRSVTVGGNTYSGGNVQKAALSNAVKEQRIADIEAAATSTNNAANGGEALKFLSNSIKENYASTKAKGVHLVDPGGLHSLASGNALTQADLNAATLSAMEGISADLMSSQKGVTLNRIESLKVRNPTSTGAINAKASAIALQANKEIFDKMGQTERTTVARISV